MAAVPRLARISFLRPLLKVTRARDGAGAAWAHRGDPVFQVQVVLLAVFAAASIAFAHVVEDYLTGDPLVQWDVRFAVWLHEHSTSLLTSTFKIVTLAGNVAFLVLLTAVAAYILIRRRAINEAALVCIVALGIELGNAALKLLFQRPRPELAYVHLETYSFPSGHAAGSAAIYGALAYVLVRKRGRRSWIAAALGFLIMISAIGFSRLYLEVHYLSDVLAGISLGIAWVSACLFSYERYRARDVRRLLPARATRLLDRLASS
jgi:membrane-associated phospholipid phosphatase